MAGSASVLTDDSVVSRLDQKFHRLEQWLALLSGLTVFALLLLAVVSVSGRNFFNSPIPGYVDWIEQALPLIAFMGIIVGGVVLAIFAPILGMIEKLSSGG